LAPRIVAESLAAVPDPLVTALHAGPVASGRAVVGSLCESLSPAEDQHPVPPWLLPEQVRSFRRVLAALRRYRGAILADPVGSGKSYVALAVAVAVNRGTTVCLVPAMLLHQWKQIAAGLGVPVTLCSHEQASRGRLPQQTRGLVVIDESHHFRNPQTLRYAHTASWLVGRPALMLTATPVVNRVSDLAHQLLLSVRDDALVLDGVVSIRELLARGCATAALGHVIIEADPVPQRRPARVSLTSSPLPVEEASANHLMELLQRLRLSRVPSIAALLRAVILRAAGSSPAAIEGALRRYRRLLLHARDALAAGRQLERPELHRFTAGSGDQLLWWELMPAGAHGAEIQLDDLDRLDDIIAGLPTVTREGDGKLSRLRRILGDGRPTLIFAGSRDTVRYLRDQLGELRLAWCTGDRAGIGTAALPRRDVLGWFREETSSPLAPHHLIVTDVAAEGLDLPRAARVVHYDLPWTPMRLEQREGRSARYGSRHTKVEVVTFLVPRILERSLQLESTLLRKARLPSTVGLGPNGRHLWRWRSDLSERWRSAAMEAGKARVLSPESGFLAGFALHDSSNPSQRLSATLVWLQSDGSWTEAPETLTAWLSRASASQEIGPMHSRDLERWLPLLARVIRERVALTQGRRWLTPNPAPSARFLAARLQKLVADAARQHEPARLRQLERAIEFLGGGHTAGEAAAVQKLSATDDRQLMTELGRVPHAAERLTEGVEVRLTGMVVFGPA
jgi:superfamily II DNA or RNA helicase